MAKLGGADDMFGGDSGVYWANLLSASGHMHSIHIHKIHETDSQNFEVYDLPISVATSEEPFAFCFFHLSLSRSVFGVALG